MPGRCSWAACTRFRGAHCPARAVGQAGPFMPTHPLGRCHGVLAGRSRPTLGVSPTGRRRSSGAGVLHVSPRRILPARAGPAEEGRGIKNRESILPPWGLRGRGEDRYKGRHPERIGHARRTGPIWTGDRAREPMFSLRGLRSALRAMTIGWVQGTGGGGRSLRRSRWQLVQHPQRPRSARMLADASREMAWYLMAEDEMEAAPSGCS